MASIDLVDASVEIPIFNSKGRSLKTTLIRRVGGQVEADGRAVVSVKALRLIDMEMGMDPELTGADNIVQRGVFLGMSLREARRAIPNVAEFSELGPYLHLPMRTYSSGMRMRLAFATSTTRHPDILLFDEMISFGDIGFALRAKARLDAMLASAKILVLASHDLASLQSYCNRAALLEAGAIVGEGAIENVWKQYTRGAADDGDIGALDADPRGLTPGGTRGGAEPRAERARSLHDA